MPAVIVAVLLLISGYGVIRTFRSHAGQDPMTAFDEAAIARAAQVLAGRVSTGRADWAAYAVAVLDAAHQAVDPQVELTVLYTLTCAGCGSDWAAGVDGLGARTEAELLNRCERVLPVPPAHRWDALLRNVSRAADLPFVRS